ncbi:MAG: AAA family ATPase [Acidobacteriota bacterium]
MEKEVIGYMQAGNERNYSHPMMISPPLRIKIENRHPELSASQYYAVDEILLSREKFVGLEGLAGAGKTKTLAVIREGEVAEGYRVEGFARTSRAAQKLAEAGIETSTLQRHLAKGERPDTGEKRFFVLDESSLASTRQMHEFIERLQPKDRVLLVGDTRQHDSVEASPSIRSASGSGNEDGQARSDSAAARS